MTDWIMPHMPHIANSSFRLLNPRLTNLHPTPQIKKTYYENLSTNRKTYLPGKLLVFASGKGGVGKTSLSVNIALLGSQAGRSIALIDGDLGKANAHVLLGVQPQNNLSSLLEMDVSLKQLMVKTHNGLKFVAGAVGRFDLANMDGWNSDRFANAIGAFRKESPLIIMDAPAGYSKTIFQWIGASDELVVVTTPFKTALLDAYGLIKIAIKQYGINNISVLVNMVNSQDHGMKTFAHLNQCVLRFMNCSLTYLGAVRKDVHMDKSLARGHPLVCQTEKSIAKNNLIEISRKLF